jgi:hypothetical protein
MQAVFKYCISFTGPVALQLPVGARVVHVGRDALNVPCIWALIDLCHNVLSPPREFSILGTGATVSDSKEYIGTFFDMPFVWHVFADPISS